MLLKSLGIFIAAIAIVSFFTKQLIQIAHKKHLFDEPLETRKIHKIKTPNLGGLAIIGTIILLSCLIFKPDDVNNLNWLVLSFLILFLNGVTDDLIGVHAYKKVAMQFCSALIITIFTGLRFTSFYGFLGFTEMPFIVSLICSAIFITFMINAFNLIDGINCLAGGITFLICAVFVFYFFKMGDTNAMFFSLLICGCLCGFLWFNKTPARIFMGDTGSTFLGFAVALLSIHFLELNKLNAESGNINYTNAVNIVVALLIIPVYDTLRVFIIRISKSMSPFTADRNHIHHRLIDLGLTHLQATGLLVSFNILFISIALLITDLNQVYFLVIATGFVLAGNVLLKRMHNQKSKTNVYIASPASKQHIKLIIKEHEIFKN